MMENSNTVFIVMRLYISASDYNSNGHTDVEVCKEESTASAIFNKWREEELQERKRQEVEYEILSDSKEKFHCAWDSSLEMVVVVIQKKILCVAVK